MNLGSYFWNPTNYVRTSQYLQANENEKIILLSADRSNRNREIAKLVSIASIASMVALHVFDYEEIFISSVAAVCASTTFWLFFDEEADKYNSKTNKIIEGLRENRLKTSIISMAEEKNAAIENAKKIQI